VNSAAGGEQGGEREGEGATAASEIRPGRRTKRLDAAVREHLDRVT
jgi:hypothetical protein